MKVVILTEGGGSIGFGHVSRCAAVVQAIRRREADADVECFVHGGSAAQDFLLREGGARVDLFSWGAIEEKTISKIEAADVTVIDSYLADEGLYARISEAMDGRLVMFDDYGRIEYPRGIVIDPSVNGALAEEGIREGKKYLCGPEYIILRKEFMDVPEISVREKISDVLICFGGASYPEFFEKTVNSITSLFEFNIHAVLPDAENMADAVSRQRVKIYRDLDAGEMMKLFLRCDICVSGGGQTLFELAKCGIPVIGIAFAANQMKNLEALEKCGFLEYAGKFDERDVFTRVNDAIGRAMSPEVRRVRSQAGKALTDGRGSERIAEKVMMLGRSGELSAANRIILRRADEADREDIWRWRNSPDVQKWCFHQGEIGLDVHAEWFRRNLKENTVHMYIAENDAKEKIGQVRFNMAGGKAHINVNLNPVFLGRGFGGQLIKQATTVIKSECPDVHTVIAEIKTENRASVRAFEKAGYVFAHNAEKDGYSILVYKSRAVK